MTDKLFTDRPTTDCERACAGQLTKRALITNNTGTGVVTRQEAKLMRGRVAVAVGAILVLGAVPVVGHHAFSAEFDAAVPLHFEGKIVKMEWINPHAWLHLEVVKEDGTKVVWMVEGGTPNTLFRRGVTRDSLLPGQDVIVDGYQAKDGSNKMNGRDLTYPDGTKLFLGSSGTGAPRDGSDATEPTR